FPLLRRLFHREWYGHRRQWQPRSLVRCKWDSKAFECRLLGLPEELQGIDACLLYLAVIAHGGFEALSRKPDDWRAVAACLVSSPACKRLPPEPRVLLEFYMRFLLDFEVAQCEPHAPVPADHQ